MISILTYFLHRVFTVWFINFEKLTFFISFLPPPLHILSPPAFPSLLISPDRLTVLFTMPSLPEILLKTATWLCDVCLRTWSRCECDAAYASLNAEGNYVMHHLSMSCNARMPHLSIDTVCSYGFQQSVTLGGAWVFFVGWAICYTWWCMAVLGWLSNLLHLVVHGCSWLVERSVTLGGAWLFLVGWAICYTWWCMAVLGWLSDLLHLVVHGCSWLVERSVTLGGAWLFLVGWAICYTWWCMAVTLGGAWLFLVGWAICYT